jgi:hypothetical protein
MAKAQIHQLKPQPTIAKAVAAANAHVSAVHAAAQKGQGNSK